MTNEKWNPSPADVRVLCEAVLDKYIETSYDGCDYCQYCGRNYGNVSLVYWHEGKEEPHDKDCPVLIARDVMTGIPT